MNIRSLNKKAASIKNYKEINDTDFLLFTETQIVKNANTEEIEHHLYTTFQNGFQYNDVDKFKGLAVGQKESVRTLERRCSGIDSRTAMREVAGSTPAPSMSSCSV